MTENSKKEVVEQNDFNNKISRFLFLYSPLSSGNDYRALEAIKYLAALAIIEGEIPYGIIDKKLLVEFKQDSNIIGLTTKEVTVKYKEELNNYFLNKSGEAGEYLKYVYKNVKEMFLAGENNKSPFEQVVDRSVVEFINEYRSPKGDDSNVELFLGALAIKGRVPDSLFPDKNILKSLRKSAFELGLTSETGEVSESVRRVLQDIFNTTSNKPSYDRIRAQLSKHDEKRGERGI